MSYYLKMGFDDQFAELLMYLKSKYPEKLFNIDGIGAEQTDVSQFSKDFFNTRTTAADTSIDSNSNVAGVDVVTFTVEMPKPIFKLNSYFVLWKKLKQLYGHEHANRIIESALIGSVYINDMHFLGAGIPYCFNYSTNDIAQLGLPMVAKIKSVPPKYLYSFKSQLEQFVIIAANNTAGATGLADIFITMSMYINKILQTGKDAHFYFEGWKDITPGADNSNRTEPYNKEIFERAVWDYVKENLVSFIYTINQPMRGGIQSPFTNVSVYDDVFLEQMLAGSSYVLFDKDKMYEATKETVVRLQDLFLDTMNEELTRTMFTFPVTTGCLAINKDKEILDKNFLAKISEKNLQFGFINFYAGSTSTLSSCCRLRSETDNRFFATEKFYIITLENGENLEVTSNSTLLVNDEDGKEEAFYIDEIQEKFSVYTYKGLQIKSISEKSKQIVNNDREYHNSFGGGSTKIGSIGVATINLPRLAYKNIADEQKFFEELKINAEDTCRINHSKRHIIQKRVDSNNAPLYKHNFIDIKKQYSTTGIIGLKECLDIMGYDILTSEGQEFVFKILDTLNLVAERFERFTKYPHNLEQIPGESAAVKLAEKDKLLKYQNNEYNYSFYSNQFIPLIAQADLFDRIKLQGMFDSKFSGGAILHINVDTKITDAKKLENLISHAINQGVIYFAINYAIKECDDGHNNVTQNEICDCGKPFTSVYSRPVGYITKTQLWGKVKREDDFANRKFYQDIQVKEKKEIELAI